MKKNHRLNAILIIALTLGFGFTIAVVSAAPPVVVDSAVPDQAEKGTIDLPVIINGRGFDTNMDVKFCRSDTNETCMDGGVDVKPGSVRFISSKKLEVIVDVGLEAIIGNFDIEAISLSSGRRGRGIEKFEVLPPITYTAELMGRVFHFGSPVDVTPDEKGGALYPDPAVPLTFSRPGGDILPCAGPTLEACLAWDAVFAACENFFGPDPIRDIGPTPIVVSEFMVPADDWNIQKAGGVRLFMSGIPFDSSGNSPPEGDPYFTVTLQLIGDTFFDSPDASWLPGPGSSIPYNIIDFWITGGTVKGVHPKKGCVSGGSAERTDFDPGQLRTLKIEAFAAP